MKRKTLQGKSLQIKQEGEEGRFSAVFATLNVIDHDGDVIMPGSIESGQKVRISAYNHSSWGDALPVGKGVVTEQDGKLIVDGQFFMDTQTGAETYKVVKNLEDLTEYSFGFDITDAEFGQQDGQDVQFIKGLNIFEVSPVLLGAGIGTRTLDIKSEKEIDSKHLKDIEEFRKKGATGFEIDKDGTMTIYGAAIAENENIPGWTLNGDGSITTHNINIEPDKKNQSETFADHAQRVQEDVAGLVKRCQDIAELRRTKGKELGKESKDRIQKIRVELEKSIAMIHEITAVDDTVEQEYLKFIERRIKNG